MATAAELYGRPWSEREYIVVLHQYFLHQDQPFHADCEHVKSTATLLGRTAGAVAMRMENYASIDPSLSGKRAGLSHINAFGRKVFNHWNTKREALAECAAAFIRDQQTQFPPTLFEPFPVRIPRAFDHYELVDQIGAGGCGTVFSCIEVDTQKLYAIKVISAEKIYDDEAAHRFRREIKALKSRLHANVIRLHEDNLDSERNFPAYVMDYASHSLTSYAEELARGDANRERPLLPSSQAIQILTSILDAVHELHQNDPRMIHRDINPNNILRMPDGSWVLADFGLAKFISSAPMSTSFQTTTQRGWGTQWYTAPEQYRNFRDVDERTDIYSLGVLMWELFTGSHPPPDRDHLGLSDRLTEVFLRATHRDPTQRYQSVTSLRMALDEAIR